MKMKTALFFLSVLLLFTAGCKTTETKPVSWKDQSAYLAKVRDPRIYGFGIYQTPGGVEYRGGCRLHAHQGAVLPMKAEKPFRPAVALRRSFGLESTVLLDFSVSSSWLEFDLAQSLGAIPVGEGDAQLVKLPGEEFGGCPSVIPSLRFKQLFIEHSLVYVRMATGPIGLLARGIEKPELEGVIGWEQLRKLKQIQLDYAKEQVVLSTVETAYAPDPALVVAKIPLVKHAGACAVRGIVNGKESTILIDPAGDFEMATDSAAAIAAVQLDADLLFSAPAVAVSPGGIRIGARLLQNYKVTVCPQAGMIYFEKL